MALRIALRTLLRSRWHAVATVGTIALTISLSSTVFAVVDGVLFRPLPFPNGDRLFFVDGVDAKGRSGRLSAIDVRYLTDADSRLAVCPIGGTTLAQNPDRPFVSVSAGAVGPNFFDVLGIQPLMGGFVPEHFAALVPGAPRPAILTYQAWRRWLSDRPNPIGAVLELPGARLAVVGVLPKSFISIFGGISEVIALVPLVTSPAAAADRWTRGITSALVRVPPEVSVAQVSGQLDAVFAGHQGDYPIGKDSSVPHVKTRMRAVSQAIGDVERSTFRIAFLGTMLLVVMGALNVTALTVARSGDRIREFGLRAALGASRSAIVSLWLTEAAVVAVLGAAAGLALAPLLVQTAIALVPWSRQIPGVISLDWRVAGFACFAAVVPLLLTAAIPAIRVSRHATAGTLRQDSRVLTGSRSWSRGVLLVAESAIGMTLVIVSSLMWGGYLLLRSEHVGFDVDKLAIVELARVRGETSDVWTPREALAFERIRQVPGVSDVATIGAPFLARLQQIRSTDFARAGSTDRSSSSRVYELPVSGAFFEVAGLELVAGRFPTRAEIDRGEPLAVINAPASGWLFGNDPPIGQVLDDGKQTLTVVGVVELAQFTSQIRQQFGQIYVPINIKAAPDRRTLLVRTDASPQRVAEEIGKALRRDIPGVLVVRSESMNTALQEGEPVMRFDALLFGVAGAAALVLVSVGVAGLVATNVARRVRELGIRTTLGAKPVQLIRMVVSTQLRPVMVGLAIGLLASWWTSKLVRAYRYDSHDPRVWSAAVLIVLAAAVVAAWIPARRASRVDPTVALRAE